MIRQPIRYAVKRAMFQVRIFIKFGEYPEMLKDPDNGILDLIVTPQKGEYKSLVYKPFKKIVVIGSAETETSALGNFIERKDLDGIHAWLKQQIWYGTTADMEHLRRFWYANFGKRPDFKPNYIVPNMSSIIRGLSAGKGVAVIPDFLSKKEIDAGKIKVIWEGFNLIENTLYFGTRKRTMYSEEIRQIHAVFEKEMI
jgi:DNA-binding transcriptional LysR family regulator